MDMTALLLSRLQFAFTISFHIIFPSFTIGLAAWLAVLEALHLATGRAAYRLVFDFWLKIFGVAFGLGVVSGIVMAFQFGTNWSELSKASGPIQGPLLSYETFTAFFLEASFFGILLFGRSRVGPWFYLFSTAMVALGTTLSAFWIMVNNSWMQVPVGYVVENGVYVPVDWFAILFSPVVWVRFPHMLLASYLTGAFCVAATGAWYLLRGKFAAEAHIMLRMGLFLAAVLVPVQIFFGHLTGDYVHDHQPAKFAAIEARWHDEQPASEVLIAIPDPESETNDYAISIPILGSLIGSMSFDSKEVGLTDFRPDERPPVLIPFFAFRIMVGCGLVMLLVAWLGTYLNLKGRLEQNRLLLWATFLSFPLPFIAILTGWFTAEVGRQPWVVYGVLRTADAMTPFLTARAAATSLIVFCALYSFIFLFGVLYIYRLLRKGPEGVWPGRRSRQRPIGRCRSSTNPLRGPRRGRLQENNAMITFWVAVLAISTLLYVLLDGFDLGVGILFGLTGSETRRRAMFAAVAPIWDGNETWLVVVGVILWGAFPVVYATLLSAFYLPLFLMLAGLILRGVAFEFRAKTERMRWVWDLGFAGGSFVAAFIQGLTVGALVEGLPIVGGQYAGGDFGWLTPFAVLCGLGLCLGYALLGACWLVKKCEGDVRDAAYREIPYLAAGLLALSDRGLHLRAGGASSGHEPLARAALSVRLSRGRPGRGRGAGGEPASPP